MQLSLIEAKASELIENNYYMVAMPTYNDDTGEETVVKDIGFFHRDEIPGNGTKLFPLMNFCRGHRIFRLSQLPGAKFYGPIDMNFNVIATT